MPYLCLKVNYTTIFRCDQTLVEFPVKHHNDINTLLVCFVYQDSLIEGVTQVYSAAHGVAQCIEAHTTTFVTHKFTGNLHESVVLCAASRLLDSLHGRVCTYMSLKGNTIHIYLLLTQLDSKLFQLKRLLVGNTLRQTNLLSRIK